MHRFLFYKEFQMLKTKVLNVTMDGIASTANTFYKTAKVIEDIQSCWFKKKSYRKFGGKRQANHPNWCDVNLITESTLIELLGTKVTLI